MLSNPVEAGVEGGGTQPSRGFWLLISPREIRLGMQTSFPERDILSASRLYIDPNPPARTTSRLIADNNKKHVFYRQLAQNLHRRRPEGGWQAL